VWRRKSHADTTAGESVSRPAKRIFDGVRDALEIINSGNGLAGV
jgi:hypothetical protein